MEEELKNIIEQNNNLNIQLENEMKNRSEYGKKHALHMVEFKVF